MTYFTPTLRVASLGVIAIGLTRGTAALAAPVSHDLDGDGQADLLVQHDLGGKRHWQGQLSKGSNFETRGDWSETGSRGVKVVGISDANGDGKAEVVLQYYHKGKRRWQARLSTGAKFDFSGDWTDTGTPKVKAVGLGDANGDGKADLFLQYDHKGKRRWQVRLSTGSKFNFNGDGADTGTANVEAIGVADVNGDGKDDVVLQYDHKGKRRWQARLSTGTKFAFNGDWADTGTAKVTAVGLADANGDGKADLVLQYDHKGSRRWQVRLSTGSKFDFNGDWTETKTRKVSPVGLADTNGDGKADLVLQYDHKGSRRWQARLSTGTKFDFNGDWSETKTRKVVGFDLADANGDGKKDLFMHYDHKGTRRFQVRLSTGTRFEHNGDWSSTATAGVTPTGSAWRTPIIRAASTKAAPAPVEAPPAARMVREGPGVAISGHNELGVFPRTSIEGCERKCLKLEDCLSADWKPSAGGQIAWTA